MASCGPQSPAVGGLQRASPYCCSAKTVTPRRQLQVRLAASPRSFDCQVTVPRPGPPRVCQCTCRGRVSNLNPQLFSNFKFEICDSTSKLLACFRYTSPAEGDCMSCGKGHPRYIDVIIRNNGKVRHCYYRLLPVITYYRPPQKRQAQTCLCLPFCLHFVHRSIIRRNT